MTKKSLTRREFLQLMGLSSAALGLPGFLNRLPASQLQWPRFQHGLFPKFVKQVLNAVPDLTIDNSGFLILRQENRTKYAPLISTIWNQNRRRENDRLEKNTKWGIVLHWFGNEGVEDQALDAYLRGFDAIRPVFNYETRTSAHFLVGNTHPSDVRNISQDIGVVQTQVPDTDGTPFLASHLQALDYTAHWDKKQYFVRALYELAEEENKPISVLQELFDSPRVVDPNIRTIAIEISGANFDAPETMPGIQKIANVAGLVWALMIRYQIRASDILGHHEIQLGKSDPGKKFMALIRYVIGLLALREQNLVGYHLVFGEFNGRSGGSIEAVKAYFNFVRHHLVLVGTPRQVYEWEAGSNFWLAYDAILGKSHFGYENRQFREPVYSGKVYVESGYLVPDNHEGADFTIAENSQSVKLIASGQCLYVGDTSDAHWGKMALMRHRQADGAEIIAAYSHLESFANIKTGIIYPQRFPVGQIRREKSYQDAYLHLAIAYGATWDTDLSQIPHPPPNAGSAWIRSRYLDPQSYLLEQTKPLPLSKKGVYYE